MAKRWCGLFIFVWCLSIATAQISYAAEVRLVGNEVETFIDKPDQVSRLTTLLSAALKDTPHSITATTQAWSGSGLRNGRYDGYICLLYTSDAADDLTRVVLGGRLIHVTQINTAEHSKTNKLQ